MGFRESFGNEALGEAGEKRKVTATKNETWMHDIPESEFFKCLNDPVRPSLLTAKPGL